MKIRNVVIFSLLLLFGLCALIIFLTVPEARMDTAVFWIAFICGIPVNFAVTAVFAVWGFSKSSVSLIRLPTAFYISGIFSLLMLKACFSFAYVNVTDVTWPIITFSALMVIGVILAMYGVLAAGYMADVEQVTAKKRLFIKMMEADVLDCIDKSTSEATRVALRALAENIRFSDPMSHDSLSSIEADISSLIASMSADLSADPAADLSAKLKRTEALLSSRNNRCVLLK